MLLDEDPATVTVDYSFTQPTQLTHSQLIAHTITNFNIAPDKAALSRISSSLSTLEESRSLRLRDAETALRKLTRQLSTLQSQHKETVVAHESGAQHAAEIVELDTRKFRVAKQVRDAEEESERLEGELESLRAELERVEEEGVEGCEGVRRTRGVDDPTM
jgi:kinetochore protein Spc24